MRSTLDLVQSANAAEKAARNDGRRIARECGKSVYVHLVEERGVNKSKSLEGKKMWTVGGASFRICRIPINTREDLPVCGCNREL